MPDAKPHSLDSFFRPRSVAIIGASSTPTKIGGVPVAYFKRLSFKGPIFPVNQQQSEIQELKAYPTVSAIGQPVDLAVVAVPAVGVLNALADAARAGVKAVVLFSSGFAEVGEEGARMQAKLTELSRQSGMRILGPNCLGVMSGASGVYATFSPVANTGTAPLGSVGLVS